MKDNHRLMPLIAAFSLFTLGSQSWAESVADPSAPLSEADMKRVKGGMEVQSFNAPTNNQTFYTDNVQIDVDLRHEILTDNAIIVETNVNGGLKEDSFVVSTTLIRPEFPRHFPTA